MRLGYIQSQERGQTDRLLEDLAITLLNDEVPIAGVVQTNSECHTNPELCDMDVRVLPNGNVHRISQSLGKNSRGCRLDPNALEQAVAESSAELKNGVKLLIVNKFGKHEADGRGFRPLIAEALSQDIPVILGVGSVNVDAFMEFSAGAAEKIPATPDDLRDWVRAL